MVQRTLQSKMTDQILEKPFEKMTLATYKMWSEDILAGNYKIVKVQNETPLTPPDLNLAEEDVQDDETDLPLQEDDELPDDDIPSDMGVDFTQ